MGSLFEREKKNILVFMLYLFLAMIITAPFAANKILPGDGDLNTHAAFIMEAKTAIKELQFPIRVAPGINHSMRDPVFQFYSPLPYMIGGLLYLLLPFSNPLVVMKAMLWLSLMFGGFFLFKTALRLTRHSTASLLAGAAYILSPYIMVNINIRGDFTETLAQGILPIVLYTSLILIDKKDLKSFILASLAWAMLITTHLLTFAYFTAFFAIYLGFCVYFRTYSYKIFVYLASCLTFAGLLTFWYLMPIIQFNSILIIHYDLIDPSYYKWLTPILSMLSLKSVSPVPLNSGHLTVALYPAAGFAVLIGLGLCIYALFDDKKYMMQNPCAKALLYTCLIALFCAWSPIDFWKILPRYLTIIQFTYRLMTQVMWAGALAFAYGLSWFFKDKLNAQNAFFILCIVSIANSSWIHSEKSGASNPKRNAQNFINVFEDRIYRVDPALVVKSTDPSTEIMLDNCVQKNGHKVCQYDAPQDNILVALPILYYPQMMQVKINGQKVKYYPLSINNLALTGVKLVSGPNQISVSFPGLAWANYLCILAWLFLFFLIFKSRRSQGVSA